MNGEFLTRNQNVAAYVLAIGGPYPSCEDMDQGYFTFRFAYNVMQALDPNDLAAIATEIVRFTRELHGHRDAAYVAKQDGAK